jgi:hypothetical protein
MTKYLILFEPNPNAPLPPTREENFKKRLQRLESVKDDIAKGVFKDFGVAPDTSGGYATFEGNEKELFVTLAKWMPAINFKIRPVLSIEDYEEVTKKTIQS